MIGVLGALIDIDLDPFDPSGEACFPSAKSSVTGVPVSLPTSAVSSAEKTMGTVASTRPSPTFCPIEVERGGPTLAQAAAVIVELDPDLMLSGRDRVGAVHLEPLKTEQVVAVRRLAIT